MELLLGAAVIAFVVVACFLIRYINKSTLKDVVFKDRSVVKAGCMGNELCNKYSDCLASNEISCITFTDPEKASEFTHLIFLYNDDDKNIEAINNCLKVNSGAVIYSIVNDNNKREEYAKSDVLIIENKNDALSVMYNIIAGLPEAGE